MKNKFKDIVLASRCTAIVQPHWLRQGQPGIQSDAGRNRADSASC